MKKHVVISEDIFNQMRSQQKDSTTTNKDSTTTNLLRPFNDSYNESNAREINSIWEREGMTQNEKIDKHTELLNAIKQNRGEVLKSRDDKKQRKSEVQHIIVESLPKNLQSNAERVLSYLKKGNILSWNDDSEVIYKGDVFKGTNIVDNLYSILDSNNKRKKYNVFEENLFLKGLSEANIPNYLIKNKKKLDVIKSYRYNDDMSEDDDDDVKNPILKKEIKDTPIKRKKPNNWMQI